MPEVILLQDVENLGEKGTVVDVSKGYLRNYLVPRKLAQPATKGLLEQARRATEAAERAKAQAAEAAQQSADAIRDARGLDIDRRKVHLEEPIRNVGTYQVNVDIGDGATASVKTIVVDNK